jgi:hypothetical protein
MALAALRRMNKNNAGGSLSLEPVEEPAPSKSLTVRSLGITSSDAWLEAAASEYQQGNIDQALWERALTQSRNDESLAVAAYLRSRATALRLQQRGERSNKSATPPRTIARDAHRADDDPARRAPARRSKRIVALSAAAAAIVVGVAAVTWLVAVGGADPGAAATLDPASSSSSAVAAEAPPEIDASTVAPGPDATVAPDSAFEVRHESKVEELRKAGNWNVLVLYASDWTRKEPQNSVAWTELSAGYLRLRQWDDALDAAARAARLSPNDPRALRNLGHVNLALERFAEARLAFDAALAARPDDVDALCGAALVAQHERRSKDAGAIASRVAALGAVCSASASAASQSRSG